MIQELSERSFSHWLETYKEENWALIEANPDFARWLEEAYVPLAGGWHY